MAAGPELMAPTPDQKAGAPDILAGKAVEIACEGEHHSDVHQLGRLQLDQPEIDPTLGSHPDKAAQIDGDNQR